MITKLRLFVKEHMEAILTALGVILFSWGFYSQAQSSVMFWIATPLGAIAFAVAIWSAWKKDRKEDKEREVAIAAYQRFIDMNSSESGQVMIASERQKEIEEMKKNKEKKDASS